MVTRISKSKSHSIEGKVEIFKDFSILAEYTQNLVESEPEAVSAKTFSYLACRAPKLWVKNEINLVICLARLESTLEKLTAQQNRFMAQEVLTSLEIKQIKEISVACAGVVTQLHTLTNRLGLSAAQLNGSAMRHETTNTNSREIADLALSGSIKSSNKSSATLAEARERSKQLLQDLQE